MSKNSLFSQRVAIPPANISKERIQMTFWSTFLWPFYRAAQLHSLKDKSVEARTCHSASEKLKIVQFEEGKKAISETLVHKAAKCFLIFLMMSFFIVDSEPLNMENWKMYYFCTILKFATPMCLYIKRPQLLLNFAPTQRHFSWSWHIMKNFVTDLIFKLPMHTIMIQKHC